MTQVVGGEAVMVRRQVRNLSSVLQIVITRAKLQQSNHDLGLQWQARSLWPLSCRSCFQAKISGRSRETVAACDNRGGCVEAWAEVDMERDERGEGHTAASYPIGHLPIRPVTPPRRPDIDSSPGRYRMLGAAAAGLSGIKILPAVASAVEESCAPSPDVAPSSAKQQPTTGSSTAATR